MAGNWLDRVKKPLYNANYPIQERLSIERRNDDEKSGIAELGAGRNGNASGDFLGSDLDPPG